MSIHNGDFQNQQTHATTNTGTGFGPIACRVSVQLRSSDTQQQALAVSGHLTARVKPWQLHLGCHRGTLMSRDADVDGYDTLEQCKNAVELAEKEYARLGYLVWYAYAVGPDGVRVKLHEGNPYY